LSALSTRLLFALMSELRDETRSCAGAVSGSTAMERSMYSSACSWRPRIEHETPMRRSSP
jgi:hypothetical protein